MKWSKKEIIKHTEDGKGKCDISHVDDWSLRNISQWCSRAPSPIPQYCLFPRKTFLFVLPFPSAPCPLIWDSLSLQLKVGLQVMSVPLGTACFSSPLGGAWFSAWLGFFHPSSFSRSVSSYKANSHSKLKYCFKVIKCLCYGKDADHNI